MSHKCKKGKCCMCGDGFGLMNSGWITHEVHRSHIRCVDDDMRTSFLSRGIDVFVLDNTKDVKMIVKSGEPITVEGWYRLVNHSTECYIPPASSHMFFKKREEAPMTGSCEHVAEWEFISKYDGDKA